MTRESRLRLLRIIHRRQLRSQGEPAPLCDDERKEIQRRVDAGENAVDLAREFGCMLRQVHSVMRTESWRRGHGYEMSSWRARAISVDESAAVTIAGSRDHDR